MMCDRCADLMEEIAYLKGELGEISNATFIANVMRTFKLSPGPARLAEVLYRANGRIVSKGRLGDLMESEAADGRIIDVYLCRLRKRLGRDAFDAPWGQGVGMTVAGRERITQAQQVAA